MSFKRTIATAGGVGLLAITSIAGPAFASSHREAPEIAKDPTADITDLYAFVSPHAPNKVNLIANFDGFQEPAGGPNFYSFDDNVLYWIKVDNTGDGVEDVTYTFQFTTHVANPDSFLYSGYGPIPAVAANVTQTVDVRRNGTLIGNNLSVTAPNIGPRTSPNYNHQAIDDGVHSLSGTNGMVFTGQRDDPFFVDLGAIFDLGGLRPFNAAHLLPLPTRKGQDDLAGFNVNSIALQVPKSKLTSDGMGVSGPSASNAVIGIWAGASRQSTSVLAGGSSPSGNPWVQVSRLGNPLINEVIIPIGEKDAWNASDPADDSTYTNRYLNSELAAIINTVYPSLPDARTTGRTDLQLILGQGIPGLNQTNATGLYDMLRLNMGVPPAAHPKRLGAMAGDLAGFPNGRRLTDDVVDIEVRAVADGYGAFLHGAFGLPNNSPNNQVGDGCNKNDHKFLAWFPYIATPWQGYRGGQYRNSPCKPVMPAPLAATSSRVASSSAMSALAGLTNELASMHRIAGRSVWAA